MGPAILLLAGLGGALALASRRRTSTAYVPAGVPAANLPPGTPVVGMRAGERYTVTVQFVPNAPILNVDTLAQVAQNLSAFMNAPNFVVDSSLTKVAQNTDGSLSGQATALYTGGGNVDFDRPGSWTLLQLQTAVA